MPAERTPQEVIREILNPGRMVADGIPYADYEQAVESCTDPDAWIDFWCAKGDQYVALAAEAHERGHAATEGQFLWHASLSYHYGQFMAFHDPPRREAVQKRKVELYNEAAPLLVQPGERIEVPCGEHRIPGFLKLPAGSAPDGGWPCVLLIGGLESTKEEYPLFERLCHDRGLATFAFDGPGQGEFFFQVKLVRDFETYTSACVDYLEQRPEIDGARLGVVGRSLGGYYAPRSAAADGRLKAAVAWGTFFDMSDFDSMAPGTAAGFAYVTGAGDFEAGRAACMERLNLADVAGDLRAPLLIVQGAHDAIFTPRQLDLAIAGFENAQLEVVLREDGDHCCHNIAAIVRPQMASWIADKLGARP